MGKIEIIWKKVLIGYSIKNRMKRFLMPAYGLTAIVFGLNFLYIDLYLKFNLFAALSGAVLVILGIALITKSWILYA